MAAADDEGTIGLFVFPAWSERCLQCGCKRRVLKGWQCANCQLEAHDAIVEAIKQVRGNCTASFAEP